MYDTGIKYVRIGQYEDTSDLTGWDWTEQKKGILKVAPHVDEYVDSLIANGATIELQLLYGNAMYTSPAGVLPTSIAPTPATVHMPDFSIDSIFWPPTTRDQTSAFLRYTRFMVNHFRGRVQYYAVWNEADGSYWNPRPSPQQFGALLGGFARAAHETDAHSRIVYGGQASFDQTFARETLDACKCAGELDVFAYHTYPGGFVLPVPPEIVAEPARALRESVSSYPGISSGLQFWLDEYNSVPSRGPEMNEAIQAKYVARMVVSNWAAGVPTFLWELINDTSTDEGDDFGMIHGLMHKLSDFQPRPAFFAMQRINALLGDTHRDAAINMDVLDAHSLDAASKLKLSSHGFRSLSGKAIVTYWLATESRPEVPLPAASISVAVTEATMEHPLLVDLDADKITPLTWEGSGTNRRLQVPVKDSVMAIADASYFDWDVLPAAPSSLRSVMHGHSAALSWRPGDEYTTGFLVEKRAGQAGKWIQIAQLPASATMYRATGGAKDVFYRIQSVGASGKSGYSNVVGGDLQ